MIAAGNDDDMFEAIVASLIDYTKDKEGDKNPASQNKPEISDEDRQLKEVLKISKFENDAKTGKINLDFLKKKKALV